MLERGSGCVLARIGLIRAHGVPNARSRTVARQLDESDPHAFEAPVTELAMENGIQFFAEQLLEPKRTNTRARIASAAPRPTVTSIAHRAYPSGGAIGAARERAPSRREHSATVSPKFPKITMKLRDRSDGDPGDDHTVC